MTLEQITQTEAKYDVTILYVTRSGSHLYGTNGPASDEDFKGIYIPNQSDRLLGTDVPYINLDTNPTNQANTPDDIDCHLDSIHKFFHLLAKGETGAMDTLFSMWSDSVVFSHTDFVDWCKANYLQLITSNPHAFIGYAIGQSKKYNIRGERYNELVKFNGFLESLNFAITLLGDCKLDDAYPQILAELDNYKHIKYVQAPAPRGTTGNWTYLEVLGKKFAPTITLEYLQDKLIDMQEQYGDRARKAVDNIDWKALSHALRVVLEVRELLSTNFIKFPLHDRNHLKAVKQGRILVDDVIGDLSSKITEVDELLKSTTLPAKQDADLVNSYILSLYKEQPCKSTKSEGVSETTS